MIAHRHMLTRSHANSVIIIQTFPLGIIYFSLDHHFIMSTFPCCNTQVINSQVHEISENNDSNIKQGPRL